MLAGSVALQRLQVISGRRPKIAQLDGIGHGAQTSLTSGDKIRRKTFRRLAGGNRFDGLAFERNDHMPTLRSVSYTDTEPRASDAYH
ncbi:protein of unknown function [Aminobacter niigataensis]|nr:protein of unknown function [Aminobacter niigataensis]